MECKLCSKLFEPSKYNYGTKVFCSQKCQHDFWIKNNKQHVSNYFKKYRLKRYKPKCLRCGTEIPDSRRKSGIKTCSDDCAKLGNIFTRRTERSNRQIKFYDYKTSIGCAICGYNRYGGSLDFHHTDPNTKERRIDCSNYKTPLGVEEIKKCILLCKNCHHEVHGGLHTENNTKEMESK